MSFRRLSSSFAVFSLVSLGVFAQTPTKVFKAPPEVEEALRARVTEFFQLHVEGNFRKAYGMVAEDTKDYYFNNKKETFVSFSIVGVRFVNDECTKASVDLNTEQAMRRLEFKGVVIPIPMTTLWKIEDGKWVWYRDPDDKQLTPMGLSDLDKIRPNGQTTEEQLAQRLHELTTPEEMAKRAGKIFGQTTIDKQEVTLALDKPSTAVVTFHNGQPGFVKLDLNAGEKIAGFTATLDKVDVGANENAVLKLSYEPPAGGSAALSTTQAVEVRLFVQPFNQLLAVKVKFGAPAANQ